MRAHSTIWIKNQSFNRIANNHKQPAAYPVYVYGYGITYFCPFCEKYGVPDCVGGI